MIHRSTVGLVVLLILSVIPSSAVAYKATTIGKQYSDGLDTRLAADGVSDALRRVGYSSSSYLSGRSARNAVEDGGASHVYGLFGHANAGVFQTDEGPQHHVTARSLVPGACDANTTCSWDDYLLHLETDDLRLAVMAGCYTANGSRDWGSFRAYGRDIGIDSVLGFTGLVFYPARCGTSCNYSGNYFWRRWASYMENGAPARVALSNAKADLVAKEGDDGGWNLWAFGGASGAPAEERVQPAGPGNRDGYGFLQQADTNGVTYRTDEAGNLVNLSAPASTAGERTYTPAEARRAAVNFIEAHVSWFDSEVFSIVEEGSLSHIEGDSLYGFVWRPVTNGVAGPAFVSAEVDLRTGEIVDSTAHKVTPTSIRVTLSEDDAVAAAQRVVGEGSVVSAEPDVWEAPRWTVTIDRGSWGMGPDIVKAIVDDATGEVLSLSGT